ncbi:MAG: hypothetical protein FJ271_33925 [Planctomycetes bacterium]|nr:hypothetical protein [Planctomycetota bacterium]
MSQNDTDETPADFAQALQQQMEPFLQRVKQVTLEVIDEVGKQHGNAMLTQLRQIVMETVGVILKAEATTLIDRLRPAMIEGSDAVRHNTEGLLADLKGFITRTVAETFREHVPEYSRWAGQRIIDYVLAGTLFGLASILLCLGGIFGLQQLGVQPYATYLAGGIGALGAGWLFLRLRSRKWTP